MQRKWQHCIFKFEEVQNTLSPQSNITCPTKAKTHKVLAPWLHTLVPWHTSTSATAGQLTDRQQNGRTDNYSDACSKLNIQSLVQKGECAVPVATNVQPYKQTELQSLIHRTSGVHAQWSAADRQTHGMETNYYPHYLRGINNGCALYEVQFGKSVLDSRRESFSVRPVCIHDILVNSSCIPLIR
jgi:hypothetical protein